MGLLNQKNQNNGSGDACECNLRSYDNAPAMKREQACSNEGGCNCGDDKELQMKILVQMAEAFADIGEMVEKLVEDNKTLRRDIKKIKREMQFISSKIWEGNNESNCNFKHMF